MVRSLLAAVLLVALANHAHATDLDLVLSCPEGANNPAAPDNPQVTTCVPDANWNCSCRIYWANNSGTTLTNVVFQIEGARLPTINPAYPVSPAADFQPGGNTTLAAGTSVQLPPAFVGTERMGYAPDGFTVERGIMGAAQLVTAGYQFSNHVLLSGTNPVTGQPNYSGVRITRASISPGLTGSFEVVVGVPYAFGPTPELGALTLTASADQAITIEPQVAYTETVTPPPSRHLELAGDPFGSALVSEGRIKGRTIAGAGPYPYLRTELVLYLPYWNGSAVRADDQFNPLTDEIIVDLTHFKARARYNCPGWGCTVSPPDYDIDTSVGGALAAPATGLNAGTILRVVDNRLEFRNGYQVQWSSIELSYDAPLLSQYASVAQPNAVIDHRICGVAYDRDNTRRTLCEPRPFTFVPVPSFPSQGWFEVNHTSSAAWPFIGSWPRFATLEDGAIRTDRIVQTFISATLGTPAALGDLHDLDIIYQVPGSGTSALFNDTIVGRDTDVISINASMGQSTVEIWVTAEDFANYQGSTDISVRVLPTATDPSWVLCASGVAAQATCDAARLGLVDPGFGIADITHVRFHVPLVPQVANPGDAAATLSGYVRSQLRAHVGSSKDDPGYDPCPPYWPGCPDISHAATGAKIDIAFELGGSTLSRMLTRVVEFDPSPRVLLSQNAGSWANDTWAPGRFDDRNITLGNYELRCQLTSLEESEIYMPLTFDLVLPYGWSPSVDLLTADILKTSLPDNGQPPADYTTVRSYDPQTRLLTVVVDGTTPLSGNYLAQGSLPSGLVLKLPGAFGPGTPAISSQTCRVRAPYETASGVTANWDQTNGQRFILGSTSPALGASASATPPVVARHGTFQVEVHLENEVFDDVTGLPIGGGSTGAALEAVAYYRVNRENDFPTVEQGLINVAFVSASSDDADDIWVTTAESPARGHRGNLASNGWSLCSSAPNPCNAAALSGLGLTPAAVRWVAFGYASVDMTDAHPRSPSPGPGPHVDVPYTGTVTLVDIDTQADTPGVAPVLRTLVEVRSQSTATPRFAADLDIVIDLDCDADLGFGYDVPELCDGLDNNCDDNVDEGNPEGGASCGTGLLGVCADGLETCVGGEIVCQQTTAASSEACNGLDDDCNGVDDDDVAPIAASNTAGACASNTQRCVAGQFEDDPGNYAPQGEVCNGVDDDCNGTNDDGLEATLTPCVMEGGCAGVITNGCSGGIIVASGECALANPIADLCNGLDDDCDQAVDEDFAPTAVSCGVDACAVGQGMTTCSPSGVLGDTCDPLWNEIPDTTCGGNGAGLHVVYLIATDAGGQPVGSIRCYQDLAAGGTPVVCDTEADGTRLKVYPELLCEGVAP